MPPKRKPSRQMSPSSGCTTRHALPSAPSSNQPTLKDFMSIVPPYSAPARIWADKIRLLWPTNEDAPTQLIVVIKQRLPANLFDNVSDVPFTSHLQLLEKVCRLDGLTSDQAAQNILESGAQLKPGQSVREAFMDMKRLARLAFPQLSPEQSSIVAWTKLSRALPPSLRQTLALLPSSSYSEETLESLDKALKAGAPQDTVASIADPLSDISRLLKTMETRLSAIETTLLPDPTSVNAVFNHRDHGRRHPPRQHSTASQDVCWYHAKFGQHARRCSPPCRSYRQHQGNGKGAPPPESGLNH